MISAVEIVACRIDPDYTVHGEEVVIPASMEAEIEFYSVYLRTQGGLAKHLVDVPPAELEGTLEYWEEAALQMGAEFIVRNPREV